jgi:RimJ/RimL family protein N-acetyltransferase
VTIAIRRARSDDVDFLVELTTHSEVDPFLAARRAKTWDEVLAEIERSQSEPERFGRFVVEVDGARAGVMGFEVANERSGIARLGGLAIHPDFRGSHVSDEAARLLQRHLLLVLGYHRLELEIYGFNERAMRHAERAGFVREGIKRKAYDRHGEWVDGVLYGLIREDLGDATEEGGMEGEPELQETENEWDEARGEDAPGLTESPDEGEPKEDRRGER